MADIRVSFAAVLVCTAALVAGTPAATAQDASASERALARRQFRDGLDAAQRAEWESAYEAFQGSYALVPRPITLLNLAGAMVQTGRLVEGAEAYRSFLREATSGPEARHRDAATQALRELEARIPEVRFRVLGFQEGDVLSLDGWELSTAVLEEELPVDAGDHELVVTRAGHDDLKVRFTAREGASREVVVDARAEAWPRTGEGDGTATTIDLTTTAETTGETDDGGGIFSSPWFWIITGAVLVVGGVLAGVLIATSSGGRDPVSGNLPPYRVGIE